MAESSLTAGYEEIRELVGREAGFRFDVSTWSANEARLVDRFIDKGYRDLLRAHKWRYLEPVGVLVVRPINTGALQSINLLLSTTTKIVLTNPVLGANQFGAFDVDKDDTLIGNTSSAILVLESDDTLTVSGAFPALSGNFIIRRQGLRIVEQFYSPTNDTTLLELEFAGSLGPYAEGDVVRFDRTGNTYPITGRVSAANTRFGVQGQIFTPDGLETFVPNSSEPVTLERTVTVETATLVAAGTSIRTTGHVLDSSFAGRTITFDASKNSYTLASIESSINASINVVVNETIGDTFLIDGDGVETREAGGDYEMPFNFGRMKGRMYFDANNRGWPPIEHVTQGQILALRQRRSAIQAGRPQFVAFRPIAGVVETDAALVSSQSDGGSQRSVLGESQISSPLSQAIFWPLPNAIYALTYRYRVMPQALTFSNQYPVGGMEHGEALVAACLAAVERRENDRERGPRWTEWREKLEESIVIDNDVTAEFLGEMSDGSDVADLRVSRRELRGSSSKLVTYKGLFS